MPSFSGNNTLGWGAGGGAAKVDASGGTTSEVGVYKVHTFSGNGTLTVNTGGMVQIMIVGGGGGCSDHATCGGGAGAVIVTTDYEIGAGTYPITVGGGGSAGGNGGGYATDGGSSTMLGSTANGGGNGRANGPFAYGKSGSTSLGSTINSVATGYGPFNAGNPATSPAITYAGGGGAAEDGDNYGWITGPTGPQSGHHVNGGQGGDGTAQANWHSTYSHFGGGGGGHSGWQGSRPPVSNGGGGSGGKGHYSPNLGGCQSGTAGTPLQGGGGGAGAGGQCGPTNEYHSPNCCGKAGGSGGVFVRYLK